MTKNKMIAAYFRYSRRVTIAGYMPSVEIQRSYWWKRLARLTKGDLAYTLRFVPEIKALLA